MTIERPSVLLVEDNPADANLVEEALAEAQIECGLVIVRDGEQAVEYIERLDADPSCPCLALVVLDLNLPRVSGEAVLKRVRLSPKCGDTKVLIISSSDAPTDRARTKELGASGYFRKPSSLEQFMMLGPTVRAMLEA